MPEVVDRYLKKPFFSLSIIIVVLIACRTDSACLKYSSRVLKNITARLVYNREYCQLISARVMSVAL